MTKDKYVLGKHSGSKQIVYHSYDYDGHTIVYRASVPYKEGAPKSYYIGLVDKQMAKLKASGKLKKYSESYIRKMVWLTRRKKVAIGIGAGALVVIGVTVGTLVGYYSQFKYDNVLFSSKTLNIDRTNVLLNNDANFTFTVNDFYAKYDYSLPDKVNEVSVNGTKLTDEQYEYSEGHLKIKAEYVTGKVFIAAEAKAVDFAKDSWANIIKTANEGLASLHFRYGVDSLVGYEHSITFDTVTPATVRVIGEGHDRLIKDGVPSNKAAALTFELVDLVPGNAQVYDNIGASYGESFLKTYCDGIASYFPTEVSSNIQLVSKKTIATDSSIETENLKIFPLSYREISGVSNTDNFEESCYQYYADPYEDALLTKRKKLYDYWLRSSTNTGTNMAYCVDVEGNISYADQTTTKRVSVAFAIGETESFITDDWSTISDKANSGLKALQEYYGVGSFLGLEREIELKNDVEHQNQIARVRVIGEKHDRLANSDNLASALTFEFIDSVYSTSYGPNGPGVGFSYSKSYFRGDNSPSDKLYKRLPDGLRSSVQKVVKKTALPNVTDGEHTRVAGFETTEDYLFPLSLKESGDIYYSLAEPYNYEEETYQFFHLNIDTTNIWKDINAINRLRKHGIATNYWLRSSYCLDHEVAHKVNQDGEVMNLREGETELSPYIQHISWSLSYFPAFNIGIDDMEVSFSNDSWDNVCYYAERGLDALKEAYGLRSFIGQQREITLVDGTTNYLRVIGENEDKTESGKEAALTFEFVTLFKGASGKGFEYVPEEGIIPKWSESQLRTCCNNDVFSLLPTCLQESVKEVSKKTVVWNAEDSYDVETTNDKVFLLSINEMISNDDYKSHYGEHMSDKQIEMYLKENTHYSYYVGANDFIHSKSGTSETPDHYWLRSPCLSQGTDMNFVHDVDADGFINVNGQRGTEWFGIAPAFAI